MADQSQPKKQPLSLAKLVAIVVATIAGAGGADAAGYTFDPSSLERLGVLGSLILIAYMEYRAMPVLLRIARLDPGPPVVADAEVEVVETPTKRTTHPQLVAVQPMKDRP